MQTIGTVRERERNVLINYILKIIKPEPDPSHKLYTTQQPVWLGQLNSRSDSVKGNHAKTGNRSTTT